MGTWNWDYYTGNLTWLKDRTIYVCRAGSHAYGTNIATSDEDYRGIAVPPMRYMSGFLERFDQAEVSKPVDAVIYSLRKYFDLAAQCNPNVLELLFTDPADQLYVHPIMNQLLENKHLFLSKQAKHSFSGYAMSQLKRIKGHRKWLDNPITEKPTRAKFGLPDLPVVPVNQREAAESLVRKKLIELENPIDWNLIEDPLRYTLKEAFKDTLLEVAQAVSTEGLWRTMGAGLGMSDNFLEIVDQERRYKSALAEYDHYETWKRERNAARAELEKNFGYDCKHGMHLYRLLTCCKQILEEGTLTVRRSDAALLLEIRNGAWTYDRLIEKAEALMQEIDGIALTSKLPKSPNRVALDKLCVEMVAEAMETFGTG